MVLKKAFGKQYTDYCKVTPKFLPRLRYIVSPAKYLSLRVSWIKKEWLALFAVLLGIIIIEIFQDFRLFGGKEILSEAKELILAIVLFSVFIYLEFRENKIRGK